MTANALLILQLFFMKGQCSRNTTILRIQLPALSASPSVSRVLIVHYTQQGGEKYCKQVEVISLLQYYSVSTGQRLLIQPISTYGLEKKKKQYNKVQLLVQVLPSWGFPIVLTQKSITEFCELVSLVSLDFYSCNWEQNFGHSVQSFV